MKKKIFAKKKSTLIQESHIIVTMLGILVIIAGFYAFSESQVSDIAKKVANINSISANITLQHKQASKAKALKIAENYITEMELYKSGKVGNVILEDVEECKNCENCWTASYEFEIKGSASTEKTKVVLNIQGEAVTEIK